MPVPLPATVTVTVTGSVAATATVTGAVTATATVDRESERDPDGEVPSLSYPFSLSSLVSSFVFLPSSCSREPSPARPHPSW